MTTKRETIKEQIDQLKTKMFYLDMKDRWDWEDYGTMDEWQRELRALKAELAKIA